MTKLLATAAAAFLLGAIPSLAQEVAGGDAAKGEATFRQCAACHAVGASAKNKIGPVLNGVIGRKPGIYEGFKYSPAMIEYGQAHVWDVATLDTYLEAPRKVVTGTKMAFAGLRKPEDRANVIAYLATLSEGGTPTQ